jgi:uncharacterized protein with PIN domain
MTRNIGNHMPKFIIDENVGKLTKALRMLGFDAVFFKGKDDSHLLKIALEENRIILTRDTHILERHNVTSGKISAVLIKSDLIQEQIEQVINGLSLYSLINPFTRCLEDNQLLIRRTREEVNDRVPPYVCQTQKDYVECAKCGRIYWKGTHWEAMTKKLENITQRHRGN